MHGKGGSRMEMFRMTRATQALGMPSLDIYRNDEGNPQDPSGYYQPRAHGVADLRGAIGYAAAHAAERVVLGQTAWEPGSWLPT